MIQLGDEELISYNLPYLDEELMKGKDTARSEFFQVILLK